jgi:RpiB/LacA/LacB family sugar-phosphate isomerase
MKIGVATDEERAVVEHVAARLRERGHEVTVMPKAAWGAMATEAARRVARGELDQAVVCCWTGTGASIAANKVRGIRAALCTDAATAAGARRWNDANVLALGLRLLSEPIATEIIDAWLDTAYDRTEDESLARIREEEAG